MRLNSLYGPRDEGASELAWFLALKGQATGTTPASMMRNHQCSDSTKLYEERFSTVLVVVVWPILLVTGLYRFLLFLFEAVLGHLTDSRESDSATFVQPLS